MNSTEEVLKEILVTALFVEIEKDQILPTLSLSQDLGIDSLGFVELKEEIDKRFAITIADDDFTPETFATVSSLTALIHRYSAPPERAVE